MDNNGKKINEYLIENGAPPMPLEFWIYSPYLNIYAYPEELDYTDLRPMPPKWYRFDSFIKQDDIEDDFVLPDKLNNKSGNLIYFSLGSMGSSNVQLMKRLVKILGQLPYRFIVSKGIFGDQFDLPDNCWGENLVAQIKILPKVEIAILHGGNNSVAESFYYGKPLIIMPLFVDQYDNAQRVHEKGFGIKLDPFKCTKEHLAKAIQTLINDNQFKEKIKQISQRIQRDAKKDKLVQLIKGLVKDNKQMNFFKYFISQLK